MVTMKDVAQLAGVSITTVSHVVNGTRAVAAETKERVLDAVAKTGYTGDVIARSLVTGGTRSLGVAISLVANPYFAELMQAIESEATAAGYTLLLVDTHDEAETEEYSIRMLRARRVDGLLLTPHPAPSAPCCPSFGGSTSRPCSSTGCPATSPSTRSVPRTCRPCPPSCSTWGSSATAVSA